MQQGISGDICQEICILGMKCPLGQHVHGTSSLWGHFVWKLVFWGWNVHGDEMSFGQETSVGTYYPENCCSGMKCPWIQCGPGKSCLWEHFVWKLVFQGWSVLRDEVSLGQKCIWGSVVLEPSKIHFIQKTTIIPKQEWSIGIAKQKSLTLNSERFYTGVRDIPQQCKRTV